MKLISAILEELSEAEEPSQASLSRSSEGKTNTLCSTSCSTVRSSHAELKIQKENEHLINKIVRINAAEGNVEEARRYEKKSMLKTMMKLEKKRITSENKFIARRITTQYRSITQDFFCCQGSNFKTDLKLFCRSRPFE